jgi:hypothetical protein
MPTAVKGGLPRHNRSSRPVRLAVVDGRVCWVEFMSNSLDVAAVNIRISRYVDAVNIFL